MGQVIAILGAGVHGQQISRLNIGGHGSVLYDDYLPGFQSCEVGAREYTHLIGAAFPDVRRRIHDKFMNGIAFESGRVIFPGVFIGHGAQLGEHVHVMAGAVVSHGCMVGDFVTIAANAVLNGEVTVESGAFIGSGAQIRHGGITIGRNAVVGMGAIVVEDVPEGAKVYGNPAKVRVPA
jgi:acetyltransferase-like isoleucine patch superfamily enzyme